MRVMCVYYYVISEKKRVLSIYHIVLLMYVQAVDVNFPRSKALVTWLHRTNQNGAPT